jgi:hypothetical protein
MNKLRYEGVRLDRERLLLALPEARETTMLITEDQLREWLGIRQRTRLMRTLQELKISYVVRAGGRICTTQAAIDQAIVGTPTVQQEEIEFA